MNQRDEFDDNEGFQSAFAKIADAMEQGRVGMRRRGPMIGVLTVAAALFVLFAVFWSTYPRAGKDGADAGPVPMVRADTTPFKTTPDDPGGMDIPYRDSTVFETLRSANNGASKVESLLPPPEQPMAREDMFAGLKTDPIDPQTQNVTTDIVPTATPPETAQVTPIAPVEEKAPEPKIAEAAPAPEQTPRAPAVTPVTTPEHVEKTEPAAGNAKVPAVTPLKSGGNRYIQLGSVKDRAGAQKEWAKLQKEFPAELGLLTLRVQEATLPDRGTFYRIQAGALEISSAKDVCASITAKRPGGCIVVSR